MRTYLIPSILPQHSCNLLAGPSGAGKTRWLFQFLAQWRTGRTFDVAPTCQPHFHYFGFDRPLSSLSETLETMNLSIPNLTLTSLLTNRRTPDLAPNSLIILDGAAILVDKPNDYRTVASFLGNLTDAAEKANSTIVCLIHTPKVKSNEIYENPRQRALGSVAWAAFSETILLLEPTAPENTKDTRRSLYILPRNFPERQLTLRMVPPGIFEYAPEVERSFDILSLIPFDEPVSLRQIVESSAVARATVARELSKLLSDGLVRRAGRGLYVRIRPA